MKVACLAFFPYRHATSGFRIDGSDPFWVLLAFDEEKVLCRLGPRYLGWEATISGFDESSPEVPHIGSALECLGSLRGVLAGARYDRRGSRQRHGPVSVRDPFPFRPVSHLRRRRVWPSRRSRKFAESHGIQITLFPRSGAANSRATTKRAENADWKGTNQRMGVDAVPRFRVDRVW